MAASGTGGRKPATGRPVSASSMGASILYKPGLQSLSKMPTKWLGVRKLCRPLIWAAKVRLAPLGRTTSSTGRFNVSATCQALAVVLVPLRPS